MIIKKKRCTETYPCTKATKNCQSAWIAPARTTETHTIIANKTLTKQKL